jgi:predicted transcriptional regulator
MPETIGQHTTREGMRRSFRQDALHAWEGFQIDGLHLTMEETNAWLQKLEAGEDREPPPCHT